MDMQCNQVSMKFILHKIEQGLPNFFGRGPH